MKRAGGLFPQVVDFHALREAAGRAARGTRAAATFMADLEANVLSLRAELVEGTWRPGPLHTFHITDPKPRTIASAPFPDRVVHHALCAALEPTLERYAIHHSYACRRGKGNRAAVAAVQRLARRHAWFVKLDVRRFFETVDHARLLAALSRRVKDRAVLALVAAILESGGAGGRGLPIGSLTSQHLGNFVLGAVDHFALEELRAPGWVRYMDDMLLFGPDKCAVRTAEARIEEYLHDRLGQAIKTEATRVAPVHTGIPWLGFRVWPAVVRLDGARARRFLRRARAVERGWQVGILTTDQRVRSMRGLFGWAEQARSLGLRRAVLRAGDAEAGYEPNGNGR